MKTTKQRRAERARERAERRNGPVGFLDFVRSLPCRRCGRRALERVPDGSIAKIEVHHDPAGSRAHWTWAHPLCSDCHTARGDSRHNVGPETFWAGCSMTMEESAADVQAQWSAHDMGLEW